MIGPVWRSSWRWVLLHLAVVFGLAALVVALVVTTPEDAGANIGAGLLGLPLLALGLPWSLPYLANPYKFDDWSLIAHSVVALGPAFLNVMLHWVAVVLWQRRA